MKKIFYVLLFTLLTSSCYAATLTTNTIPKVGTGGSSPQMVDSNATTNSSGDLILGGTGKFTGDGSVLTNMTKSQVGLSAVENTTLSTWAGSTNITTLGTISSASIPESKLTFSDITTGNSTTSNHGYLKKLDGDSTHFMNGAGNWTVPAGSGGGGAGLNAVIVTANGFAGSVDSSNNVTLQTTVNGLVKANGTALSGATSGVDYAPATAGTAMLKGNGSGGFSSATSGTDYTPATSGSSILKGDGSGGTTAATAGTDYVTPTGTTTLTNKTLTAPVIANIVNTGTLTLPTSTDVLIGRATTDTLTNKTFDTAGTGNSFKINGTAITSISGNAAKVGTVSGSLTSGNLVKSDANGNLIDGGSASGSGTVNSGTSGQLAYYASTGTAVSGLSQINNSAINWTDMTRANQSVNWGSGIEYAASWNSTQSGVGAIQMYDSTGVNWVKLQAPSTLAASSTWIFNQPRVNTTASSATPAINVDTTDMFTITALATAITSMTSGLTGTPAQGQKLLIRIKDNGTARGITWGASFASRGATLPTTTILSKYTYVGLIYNNDASVWDCIAVSQE